MRPRVKSALFFLSTSKSLVLMEIHMCGDSSKHLEKLVNMAGCVTLNRAEICRSALYPVNSPFPCWLLSFWFLMYHPFPALDVKFLFLLFLRTVQLFSLQVQISKPYRKGWRGG